MAKIYVIMGKSSSGKDSLFHLLTADNELNLKTITTYTTRPMRQGETEGVEYFFTTEAHLEELKNAGKVLECRTYPTVYGPWSYFTADDGQIDLNGTQDYMVIGTLESFEKIRDYYGADVVIPIYVEVEPGLRLERALQRERMQTTPKYAELCRRFLADEADFSEENLACLGIKQRFSNDSTMENCIEAIKQWIR